VINDVSAAKKSRCGDPHEQKEGKLFLSQISTFIEGLNELAVLDN